MRIRKKVIGILLAAMTAALFFPAQILAVGNIDPAQNCALTISYQDGNTPLSGVKFSAYLVATKNNVGALVPTEKFTDFQVNIPGKNDAAWNTLASTLEGYILRDSIPSADSGSTDTNGKLTFPANGKVLEPGLYVVLGTRHQQNGTIYDAQPFMVLLPELDEESGEWLYEVNASPKHESRPVPSDPQDRTITRKALKVWRDEGNEDARPENILVQLLRNGKVYDTVTLNADNRWSCTWNDLSDAYQWTVVEDPPKGYTVEIVREGVTFVVTNTWNGPDDPPPDSTPGSEPTPTPDSTPSPDQSPIPEPTPIPGSTPSPDPTPTPDPTPSPDPSPSPTLPPPGSTPPPSIPQTGQLRWPIPVLACIGMGLFLAGWLKRRNSDRG